MRFGAAPVDVGALFLEALYAQVDLRPLPPWATILAADVADPGSNAARKLDEYVEAARCCCTTPCRAADVADPGSNADPDGLFFVTA